MTLSAATLPVGKFSLGLQLQSIGFERFSDAELSAHAAAGEHVHGIGHLYNGSFSLAYGLRDDLSLIASLPYVSRRGQREAEHAHDDRHEHEDEQPMSLLELLPHEHDEAVPTVRDLGAASGVGDLILLGQYRWHHDLSIGRQAAWLFGVKTPTGRTDVRAADGERLETHHQPGSGSWDALLGMAFTRAIPYGVLDANLLYTRTGEGSQDTRLGNGLAYNLGFSRRLGQSSGNKKTQTHHHPESESSHTHDVPAKAVSAWAALSWDVMLELNGEWQGYERQHGERVDHTGGHLLYLSPGVRAGVGSWSAGLLLGVPVVKNLNGIQSEPDYRLLFSVATSL